MWLNSTNTLDFEYILFTLLLFTKNEQRYTNNKSLNLSFCLSLNFHIIIHKMDKNLGRLIVLCLSCSEKNVIQVRQSRKECD